MFKFRIKAEWSELRRDIRRIDKEADRAVTKAGREAAKTVVLLASPRRSMMGGAFRSYESKVVSLKATTQRGMGAVKVMPAAAEFGANTHPVFGHTLSQSMFRRRVWPPHSGEGYLVRPTVKDHETQIAEVYADEMQQAINRILEG